MRSDEIKIIKSFYLLENNKIRCVRNRDTGKTLTERVRVLISQKM